MNIELPRKARVNDYNQARNIGKMHPMNEIKSIINEQLIRTKLNRSNKINDYPMIISG